jgi:Plasmid pRiA4b ORF-3-like protein
MASRPRVASRVTARRVTALPKSQVQLRIELRRVMPLVWRRLLVPENVTLAKLHVILQWVMGWSDSHLHEYEIERRRYGVPSSDDWGTEPLSDERRVHLKSLIESGTRRFTYRYDFGDHWEHLVKVEHIVPPKPGGPSVLCLAGENSCPPEDVGGPPGYANFLAALKDPRHPEHDHMLEWAGGSFDPTAFDITAVNEYLASVRA